MRRADLLLFGPAMLWLVCGIAGLAWAFARSEPSGPDVRRGAGVQGSEDCRRCHAQPWETWAASYHRTMTQRATGDALLPPFEGETLDALGFRATMTRSDRGQPRVIVRRLGDEGRPLEPPVLDAEVELTVGSHRFQQFVARIDRGGGARERWRLPVGWHVARGRWIHMNQAFLTPDGVPGSTDDYLRHLSRWNDNCLFCHNTEPSPGLTASGHFESTWGELGIGCEACHGPASAHVERHASPFVRLMATGEGDPTIARPDRLAEGLGSDVCGRCHGQRIGSNVAEILAHGDGFLPGRPLSGVSRPIFADSRLASDSPKARPFAERFWPDGTPRLSAYEYQALLLSPCHDEGRGLGCMDCHSMHGDDPNMQLRADYDPVGTCQRCHGGTEANAVRVSEAHGGHDDLVCTDCHMPRVTYGLLQDMMSHRVTVPRPGRWVGRHDQPDACTQCHVERSRSWAAGAMARLGFGDEASGSPDPSESWASRVVLDLYGGDPIARVLAAYALGDSDAVGDVDRRLAALASALEDEYPAVRWAVSVALERLAEARGRTELARLARGFDPMADPAIRLVAVEAISSRLGPGPFAEHPTRQDELAARRGDRAIFIGE